jgi:hypothetical protein
VRIKVAFRTETNMYWAQISWNFKLWLHTDARGKTFHSVLHTLTSFLHFPFRALCFICYSVTNKCTHFVRITKMRYYANCYTFLSSLAHSQSVHRCIKQSSNRYIIPSMQNCHQVCQCMSIEMDMSRVIGAAGRFEWVHGTVRRCAYWGWYNGWTVALYNCALPEDGSLRTETCSSLLIKTFL